MSRAPSHKTQAAQLIEQQEVGGQALIEVEPEPGVQPELLDDEQIAAKVAAANAALTGMVERAGMDVDGWLVIGEPVLLAHHYAMVGSNSGVANGRLYSDRMGEYLRKHGLIASPLLTGNVRKALKNIMINLPAVMAWRDDQPEAKRLNLIKPRSIWTGYQAFEKARAEHAAGRRRKRPYGELERRAREIIAVRGRERAARVVEQRALLAYRDALIAAGINPPIGEDELRQQIEDAVARAPIDALFEDDPPQSDEGGDDDDLPKDGEDEDEEGEGEPVAVAEPVKAAARRKPKPVEPGARFKPEPGHSKRTVVPTNIQKKLAVFLYGFEPEREPASCVMAYDARTRTPMAFARTKSLAIKAARESVVEAWRQKIRDHDAELADEEWEEEGPDAQVIMVRRTPEDVSLITEEDIEIWPTIETVKASEKLRTIVDRPQTYPERVLWSIEKDVAQYERMMTENEDGEFE